MNKIFDIITLASALFLVIYLRHIIQSFSFMGLGELRRRAATGDDQAGKVLASRVHGLKLWLVLWSVFALMVFIIVKTLGYLMTFWPSAAVAIVIIVGLLFVMPWAKRAQPRLEAAAKISPYLATFFNSIQVVSKIFHPLGLSKVFRIDSPLHIHSKEHLIEIIEEFKPQTKNEQARADLDLAVSTLTFSSKKIKTMMTPLDKIKKIKATQDLTPKLIDQLHNSGLSVFPVQRSDSQDFVGILYLEDIKKLQRTRAVHQIMKPGVSYIHAEAPLHQVVDAFLKTRQQLFLVVDTSQEISGLIDLSDVLRSYLGESYLNDFKYYDDLELVSQQSLSDKVGQKPARKSAKRKA